MLRADLHTAMLLAEAFSRGRTGDLKHNDLELHTPVLRVQQALVREGGPRPASPAGQTHTIRAALRRD